MGRTMATCFGPWATAMTPRSGSPLDAFWRRRMAMLATISASPTRPTRGQRDRLTVLAGLLLALPTAAGFSTPPAAGGAGAPQPPTPGGPPGLPGVVPGAPGQPAPGGSP